MRNRKRKTHKRLKDGTLMTWPLCQIHQHRWLAVCEWRKVEPDATQKEIDKVISAYQEKRQVLGYVTYTDLRVSRLPYPRIFAVIKTLYTQDPYSVNLTVNRMNENTALKINLSRLDTKGKENGCMD